MLRRTKRALVTGVGTSEWLGTEASKGSKPEPHTEIPNLRRLLLNEATTFDSQQLERHRDIKRPGAGLRDERTDPIAALENCAVLEANTCADRAR